MLTPGCHPAPAPGRYPTMEYMVTQDFDYDFDALFEYGLRLLLDGVEQRYDRSPAAPDARGS